MIVNTNYQRPEAELIDAYRQIAPATLGHMHNIRFMDPAIKPLFSGVVMVGPAFTVRTEGMDAAALTKVDELAQPGDIVVVDRGGDYKHAVIGEFRALKHIRMGLEGWIIDGAATDVLELQQMRFPVYARTVTALVAKMIKAEGAVGVPVQCGGVVVNPGDLIVADDNGVAVLSHAEAREHVEHGLAVADRERRMRVEYAEEYKKLIGTGS